MKAICVKLFALVWAILLVGCIPEGESPQLVASYPIDSQIAAYPGTPPDLIVVHNATLTLDVADLDKAVEVVNGLVYENRGYIASSQSWFQDDGKYTTLVLAIPAIHFDTVHKALFTLGDFVTEYVSGELRPSEYGIDDWRVISYITLHLRPKKAFFANSTLSSWRSFKTFNSAWNIFLSIFGLLVDICIWLVVVAGPFLLMFWLAAKLIRRRKTEASP